MKKKKIFSPGPRPVRGLSAPEMEQITEGLFKCRMFNLEESRTQTHRCWNTLQHHHGEFVHI